VYLHKTETATKKGTVIKINFDLLKCVWWFYFIAWLSYLFCKTAMTSCAGKAVRCIL